jgi:DNA segregation ATPase FtsK/SpoIIIE-like protein
MSYIPEEFDDLLPEAVKICCETRKISASLLQRRLSVGYARSARIVDQLEELGVVSSMNEDNSRDVLVDDPSEIDFEKVVGKNSIDLDEIPVSKWIKKDLSDTPFGDFQKEFGKRKDVFLPIGFGKGNLVSLPVGQVGHFYVFNSPLSNSSFLLRNMAQVMVDTFDPKYLGLILADRGLVFPNKAFAQQSQLMTPVIRDGEKLTSAFRWLMVEMGKRTKLFSEIEASDFEEYHRLNNRALKRIVVMVNGGPEMLYGDILDMIAMILSSGHLLGIHLIIASPVFDKKFSKLFASFPSKAVFKTFSTDHADLLGTDDAFDLKNPNEFVFIPAFGDVVKLSVWG